MGERKSENRFERERDAFTEWWKHSTAVRPWASDENAAFASWCMALKYERSQRERRIDLFAQGMRDGFWRGLIRTKMHVRHESCSNRPLDGDLIAVTDVVCIRDKRGKLYRVMLGDGGVGLHVDSDAAHGQDPRGPRPSVSVEVDECHGVTIR